MLMQRSLTTIALMTILMIAVVISGYLICKSTIPLSLARRIIAHSLLHPLLTMHDFLPSHLSNILPLHCRNMLMMIHIRHLNRFLIKQRVVGYPDILLSQLILQVRILPSHIFNLGLHDQGRNHEITEQTLIMHLIIHRRQVNERINIGH